MMASPSRKAGQTYPELAAAVSQAPPACGVYLFKDGAGRVLYVGKAVNLKHRLASYLKAPNKHDAKTALLLTRVAAVDFLLTSQEREALILERNLIKSHRPRFNVDLRDDKNYLCLRLDVREDFPALRFVRRFGSDGALYFGPYTSAGLARETVRVMQQVFGLRTCKERRLAPRTRPCLDYQMGRCLGPCVGLVNREDYGRAVQEAVQFLKGRGRSLVAALKADMAQAADNLDFERAARFRDRIQAVSRTLERQDVARPHRKDQDVLGLAVARGRALIFVLLVRQGLVSGGLGYFIPELPAGGQVLEAFLKQYYTEGRPLPDEILLPHDLPDRSLLAEVLSAQKGAAVRLVVGKAGVGGKGGQDRGGEGQGSQNSRRDRQRLLALAQENAWAALTRRQVPAPPEEALADLQIRLSLPDLPQRLECLDISTLQGGQSVGALVVFSEGRPDKSCYRRFRIRGVVCQDDFAMLREVVQRHYGKQGQDRPDLLVVDGGLGQLNVVLQALSDLGMESFPVVALAKAREKEGGEVPDRLFLPGRKNPKFLPASAPGWSLLLRLRDEAHRFAVTYHRQRARRELLTSALRQVPGIGPVRQKKLFQHFGSLEAIRNASLEELTQVPDLTRRAAQALQEWLSKTPTGEKDTADGA